MFVDIRALEATFVADFCFVDCLVFFGPRDLKHQIRLETVFGFLESGFGKNSFERARGRRAEVRCRRGTEQLERHRGAKSQAGCVSLSSRRRVPVFTALALAGIKPPPAFACPSQRSPASPHPGCRPRRARRPALSPQPLPHRRGSRLLGPALSPQSLQHHRGSIPSSLQHHRRSIPSPLQQQLPTLLWQQHLPLPHRRGSRLLGPALSPQSLQHHRGSIPSSLQHHRRSIPSPLQQQLPTLLWQQHLPLPHRRGSLPSHSGLLGPALPTQQDGHGCPPLQHHLLRQQHLPLPHRRGAWPWPTRTTSLRPMPHNWQAAPRHV